MIVRMKKVAILCLAACRDETLAALRGLGVMHLAHIRPPEGGDVDDARKRMMYLSRALEVLPERPHAEPSRRPAWECVQHVWEIIHEKQYLEETLETLRHERDRVAPFGSFDPEAVRQLREKGVFVKLYQGGSKQEMPRVEGVVMQEFLRDGTGLFVVGIGRHDFRVEGFQEIPLPVMSLGELHKEISELESAQVAADAHLERHSGDHHSIAQIVSEAKAQIEYLEARAGMGSSESLAYLRGFCPAEAVEPIRAAAARNGWGLIVEEPGPDDKVPTLIRNPRWVKPIKAVLDFIGVLPGYEEIDISAVFLLFLSLFFAMLVGDAGYGLLFIILTAWGRRKFPKAPGYPFHLLYIMSGCTVVWGAVTGSWFGATRLPAVLDGLTVAWLKEPKNVMLLCFIIGAVHLTIAHLWNIARGWNSPKALAQAGWIGSTWTMFFMARNLVLGRPLPGWIGGVFVVSVILIVLFMTAPRDFRNEWFNHVMLPLNLVSNFVDVVSYIRLFAVGTAGYAVAASFNKMILGGGVDGVVAGLVAALLLFLGHALNIMLGAMGVLVHGVRLNTLEFSSHIGMAWTGVPFRPFARLAMKAEKP